MREKASFRPPAVGGSSLLVIFAVLCLTVFALLGLSTAQAGTRISQKGAGSVQEYYRLDTAAQETLAAIRSGSVPDGVAKSGNDYSFTETSGDGTQKLMVNIRAENGSYRVLRWQLVSASEWTAEDTRRVWSGN